MSKHVNKTANKVDIQSLDVNSQDTSELYQKITDICFENGGVTKPMVDKLYALFTQSLATQKQELLDWFENEIPDRPFIADKTLKPSMEEVELAISMGVPGIVRTTEPTGHTYSEQDIEDAVFNSAKPYLDYVRQLIKQKREEL